MAQIVTIITLLPEVFDIIKCVRRENNKIYNQHWDWTIVLYKNREHTVEIAIDFRINCKFKVLISGRL